MKMKKNWKTHKEKEKKEEEDSKKAELYSKTLEKINKFISTKLKEDFAGYSDTTRDMVFSSVESGGKRIRAIISFAISKIFGQTDRRALELAYSIELSHSFTLVHDDIIDKPRERRGNPPLFARFGEDLSLLAGDMLMTFSFIGIPANAKNVFAKLMCDVIEGQILDVLWSHRTKNPEPRKKGKKIEEETIIEIQAKKTSSLFMISFVVPFVSLFSEKKVNENLLRRRKKIENLLSELGYNFGLAFQILDDVDDVEEDVSKGSPNILHVLGMEKTEDLFMMHRSKTLKALSDFETELYRGGLKGGVYLELLKYTIQKVLGKWDSILRRR